MAVMPSFAAMALMPSPWMSLVINVPCAVGELVSFKRTGMSKSLTGVTVCGCKIFAPKYASSAASSNDRLDMAWVSGTKRGSLLWKPSISVQIRTVKNVS